MTAPKGKIKIVTVAEATEILRSYEMSVSTVNLRRGLEQQRYPFGTAVKTDNGGYVYQISLRKLYEWIAENVIPE